MLSMDAKQYVDAYRFQNGMLNAAWIAGYMRRPSDKGEPPQHFHIQQTANLNHMLPIHLRNHTDVIPARYKDQAPVKCICRVTGRKLEDGERIAVLECMDFDSPTILDMPPEDQFSVKVPDNIPSDDFRPNKTGMKLSRRSNVVQIAGFVSGIVMIPAVPGKDRFSCLQLMVSQKQDLDLAVPVRIRSKSAEAMADMVKLGMPVLINDGEFRVRVKETGEPADERGINPVVKYPYIEARMIKMASADDILGDTPAWAYDLAKAGRARKPRPEQQAPAGAGTDTALEAAVRELSGTGG